MCLPQKHKWLIKGAHTNFTNFFDFIKKKKILNKYFTKTCTHTNYKHAFELTMT